MKLFVFISVSLICYLSNAHAQNHLYNGDFEQYSNCPNGPSQINYANGWNTFTAGSPDYFHVCGSNGLNVPMMSSGYQYPASGNAFAGVFTYSQNYNIKEYLTSSMSSLQPGCAYEVSMSVSLADKTRWATDDFGVYFYKNGPSLINNTLPLTVVPQVNYYNYGIISDTANWTRLSAVYIPDSTYNHIVIGGFKDSSIIGKKNLQNGFSPSAYYYIDSIVVRPLKLSFSLADTFLCQNQTVTVPFQVLPCAAYASGNLFKLQLSDSNGIFKNPVDIGSVTSTTSGTLVGVIPPNTHNGKHYRIRIYSTNSIDSSLDNGFDIIIGTPIVATTNSPICETETIQLTATSNLAGTSFSWKGPSFSSTTQSPNIANASVIQSGKYIVTGDFKGCLGRDTVDVLVKPKPTVSINTNAPICTGSDLLLSANHNGTASYAWNGPLGFNSTIKNPTIKEVTKNNEGGYKLVITVDNCPSDEVSVTVKIKDNPPSPITQDTMVCLNASNIILPALGDSLKWYDKPNTTGSFTHPHIFTGDTVARKYWVTQTKEGCESDFSELRVSIKDIPKFDLGADKSLCVGDTAYLGQERYDSRYLWNTGDTSCCIRVSETGFRTLTMSNVCGSSTDEIKIDFNSCKNCIAVPTAFTPNGDGINDRFGGLSICNLKDYTLKIYSRWGQQVFLSTDIAYKWDGTHNGKPVKADTYYYFIRYTPDNANGKNHEIMKEGSVTVIR